MPARSSREESFALSENLYFAPEIVLLLEAAGFREIELEAAYENRPQPPMTTP